MLGGSLCGAVSHFVEGKETKGTSSFIRRFFPPFLLFMGRVFFLSLVMCFSEVLKSIFWENRCAEFCLCSDVYDRCEVKVEVLCVCVVAAPFVFVMCLSAVCSCVVVCFELLQ